MECQADVRTRAPPPHPRKQARRHHAFCERGRGVRQQAHVAPGELVEQGGPAEKRTRTHRYVSLHPCKMCDVLRERAEAGASRPGDPYRRRPSGQ
jgi:hypothetical protein